MKNKIKRETRKKQIFRFLKKGYFSFPLKDKGKKFEVIDTYTIYLKDKNLIKLLKLVKKHHTGLIPIYEEAFWKAIKQERLDKEFKNCWIVPINISNIKDSLMLDVDILKPIN